MRGNKFKRLSLITFILVLLSACSNTNKYDVEIAKERFAYGQVINKKVPLVEIKGELVCTDEQKQTGNCGVIVWNTNQRFVDVEPKKVDYFDRTLTFIERMTPLGIALDNNRTNIKLAESNNALMSGIFSEMANAKNTGTTTNITDSYNDSSQHSSIQDSYNSADTSYSNSHNTSSSSSVSNSHNKTSTETNSSSSNTSGDTNSNNRSETNTENTTVNNEGQQPST